MSTSVIYSLKKNGLGIVIDGYSTTVADSNDLAKKADTTYIRQVEVNLNNNINKERDERVRIAKLTDESIRSITNTVTGKADKQAVQNILSELALVKIKGDLDVLFSNHLKAIHETCVKEQRIIEKNTLAFQQAANSANRDVAEKLQPLKEYFKTFNEKIEAILKGQSKIVQIEGQVKVIQDNIAGLDKQVTSGMLDLEQRIKGLAEQLGGTQKLVQGQQSAISEIDKKLIIIEAGTGEEVKRRGEMTNRLNELSAQIDKPAMQFNLPDSQPEAVKANLDELILGATSRDSRLHTLEENFKTIDSLRLTLTHMVSEINTIKQKTTTTGSQSFEKTIDDRIRMMVPAITNEVLTQLKIQKKAETGFFNWLSGLLN
jgi:chromosome segregation ATPase